MSTAAKASFEAQHLTRQLDLVPLHILDTPITVIGAGAIGSWTCHHSPSENGI